MKRLLRVGLSSAILLAFFFLVAMIPREWIPSLMFGLFLALSVAYLRLALENRRLKKEIRELEMGLGL